MKIVHRICCAAEELHALLSEVALDEPAPTSDLCVFFVDDADPKWPAVRRWIQRVDASHMVITQFEAEELAAAAWLQLSPYPLGYPEPEESYRAETYEDACARCGAWSRQRQPFRMRGEPRWGAREIITLNWVFDALFVRPDVYESVFAPLGLPSQVVLSKAGKTLETVVQVPIEEVVSVAVPRRGAHTCKKCGRERFRYHQAGEFPALREVPKGQLAYTRELFGTGGVTRHEILASAELYAAVQRAKLRGAEFCVVASGAPASGHAPGAAKARRRLPRR